MVAKRLSGLTGIIFLSCLLAFPCFADEILFQNQNQSQTGVVVGEDNQSVTIRFKKNTIKSIERTMRNPEEIAASHLEGVIWEESGDYLLLKIPRRSILVIQPASRTESHPEKPESLPQDALPSSQPAPLIEELLGKNQKAETALPSPPQESMKLHRSLLQEEMGSVQGVISWHGKPLQNGKVKIVLEQYTGFSVAALKKQYATDGKNKEIVLETRTDSLGRYVFPRAPAGYYRIFWLPDPDTGWIRRLREKPDFEIVAGNLTLQDIPEKKK